MFTVAQVDGFLEQKASVNDLNNKVNGSDVYFRNEAELFLSDKV